MTDDLDALLDAFDRPSMPKQPAGVPLQDAPEPEPAEPWHNEPAEHVARPEPSQPQREQPREYVPPEPAAKRRVPFFFADGRRKTPDDFSWRECWMRVTELWLHGAMDKEQFADLTAMATTENASVTMISELRARLWAFEASDDTVGKEGSIDRTRNTPADRGVDQRAVSSDQRLHDDAARSRAVEPSSGAEDSRSGERAEQATEGAGR